LDDLDDHQQKDEDCKDPTEDLGNLIERTKRIGFEVPQLRELPNRGAALFGSAELAWARFVRHPVRRSAPPD